MTKKGEVTRFWTIKEDMILDEHAGVSTLAQMAHLLDRSRSSIINRCRYRGIHLVDSRKTDEGRAKNRATRLEYVRRRAEIGLKGHPKPSDAALMAVLDDEFPL